MTIYKEKALRSLEILMKKLMINKIFLSLIQIKTDLSILMRETKYKFH
jgi:hypothetical protein